MANLTAIAETVRGDEQALGLSELNLIAPHEGRLGTGWYRFQIIWVVRDDRIAQYRERLGPSNSFKCIEFVIPTYGYVSDGGRIDVLCTVNQVKEWAAMMRHDGLDTEMAHEPPPNFSDLLYNKYEEYALWRKRQSTFGQGQSIRRS